MKGRLVDVFFSYIDVEISSSNIQIEFQSGT